MLCGERVALAMVTATTLIYSALLVSCPGELGNRQLEVSLCKLLAFVLVGLT